MFGCLIVCLVLFDGLVLWVLWWFGFVGLLVVVVVMLPSSLLFLLVLQMFVVCCLVALLVCCLLGLLVVDWLVCLVGLVWGFISGRFVFDCLLFVDC